MISGGAPVASLMISGGVSRPIGHRTNIVYVKKWGGQSPPNPPVPTPMHIHIYGVYIYIWFLLFYIWLSVTLVLVFDSSVSYT